LWARNADKTDKNISNVYEDEADLEFNRCLKQLETYKMSSGTSRTSAARAIRAAKPHVFGEESDPECEEADDIDLANQDFMTVMTTRTQDIRDKLDDDVTPLSVIIIVIGDHSWKSVASFLYKERSKILPFWHPIKVLSTVKPPNVLAKIYAALDVYFLVGPYDVVRNFSLVDLDKALSVVVFRDNEADRYAQKGQRVNNSSLADHRSVVLAAMIEKYLVSQQSDCFTMYEFTNTISVHLVEHHHDVSASEFDKLTDGKRHVPVAVKAHERTKSSVLALAKEVLWIALSPIAWFIAFVFRAIVSLHFPFMMNGKGAATRPTKLIYQRRFAAGQVFTADIFGAMAGRIYQFPGTIEFAEALTMPGRRRQTSLVYQVHMPAAWVARTWRELLQCWLQMQDPMFSECGPILPIALYRTVGKGRDAQSYMCLSPVPGTTLSEIDLVTVLAPDTFGIIAGHNGLLWGSGKRQVEVPVAPPSVPAASTPAQPARVESSPEASTTVVAQASKADVRTTGQDMESRASPQPQQQLGPPTGGYPSPSNSSIRRDREDFI
jgi:hypothetical protein